VTQKDSNGGRNLIEVIGRKDEESTGAFEVSVDGKLVHSKLNGDGFVDSMDKLDRIVTAIEDCN
jgi:selT/selW/selH-like putative selenoprotein